MSLKEQVPRLHSENNFYRNVAGSINALASSESKRVDAIRVLSKMTPTETKSFHKQIVHLSMPSHSYLDAYYTTNVPGVAQTQNQAARMLGGDEVVENPRLELVAILHPVVRNLRSIQGSFETDVLLLQIELPSPNYGVSFKDVDSDGRPELVIKIGGTRTIYACTPSGFARVTQP
ncbi:MAG: hypothetical protein KDB14_31145 [Planctomycetales bacterium]|nr:hypothetical protein [Planctomycetales bacterium]